MVVKTNDDEFFIKNNLFFGDIDSRFTVLDTNPISGDPQFKGNGERKFKYQLKATSPAINTGHAKTEHAIPGAGKGIFANVPAYPDVDFYGNPIDLSRGTPNIGACNTKKEAIKDTNNK